MKTCQIEAVSYGLDPRGTVRGIQCRTHGRTIYQGAPIHFAELPVVCDVGAAAARMGPSQAPLCVADVTEQQLRKAATAVFLVCDAAVAADLNVLLRAGADAMRERDDLRARLENPPC